MQQQLNKKVKLMFILKFFLTFHHVVAKRSQFHFLIFLTHLSSFKGRRRRRNHWKQTRLDAHQFETTRTFQYHLISYFSCFFKALRCHFKLIGRKVYLGCITSLKAKNNKERKVKSLHSDKLTYFARFIYNWCLTNY